jgi:hypothetical protein
MKPAEAAALLTIAAAYDNRKPDADQAKAWAMALDGLRFKDCREVVVEHYRRSREWLMPVDVVSGVRRLRERRLLDYGPIPAPEHLDPDSPTFDRDYRAYMADRTRAIADGEIVAPPVAELEGTRHDVVRELGHIGQTVNQALAAKPSREALERARLAKQAADAERKRAEDERRAERERTRAALCGCGVDRLTCPQHRPAAVATSEESADE